MPRNRIVPFSVQCPRGRKRTCFEYTGHRSHGWINGHYSKSTLCMFPILYRTLAVELFSFFKANVKAPNAQILALAHRLTETAVPLIFWSGYSSLVLIYSAYLQSWTVVISKNLGTKILPRRWFDISGSKINGIWEAALKAVAGVILFRPGISQVFNSFAISQYTCSLVTYRLNLSGA